MKTERFIRVNPTLEIRCTNYSDWYAARRNACGAPAIVVEIEEDDGILVGILNGYCKQHAATRGFSGEEG